MADAVTARVIINTPHLYVIHLTNICDGTGESAVVKVDKSTLVSQDGGEPGSLDLQQARWSIQGFSSVQLLWDHSTDDLACVLCGSAYEDFTMLQNDANLRNSAGLLDPRTTGGTGDLLLTTAGNVSGATYDITLWLRKTNN